MALLIRQAPSGAIRTAQIFVAVLGASNYTGACPELVEGPRRPGAKACRYEPELNPSYQQLAAHYAVAVLPARPYKPKDKAKAGVQLVERWIMAKLRHQTFFSLAELNQCILLYSLS